MFGESDESVVNFLQASVDVRMGTLQEVLIGQMSPLERRLELAERRPGILFGTAKSSLAGSSRNDSVEETNSTGDAQQEDSVQETAESVEVEIESPSEDELRVANYLAEEYSDAEMIAIESGESIQVQEESGQSFTVDVAEVLQREFEGNRDSETTASSTPSMSTVVSEKLAQ